MKKIFLPLFLAIAFCGSAQKVSNKLSLQKGQKLEITTNMNTTTEMMMGETSGNTTTTELYEVKAAEPSSSQLEKSTTHIKLNFSLMGQEKKFDSENKDDLEGDLGEPLKKILNTKEVFTIDATGKITNVVADEKKKKENDRQDMMSMFMSQMNVATAAPKAGAASAFKILPDFEVGKGDTWTDTASSMGNSFKTVYVVKDITPGEVLLDFTGDGNINSTQQMMGTSVEIKGTIKTSGAITLDKNTGLLKQKTAITTTETNMNMGGQEINSTSKATAVTTVKTI